MLRLLPAALALVVCLPACRTEPAPAPSPSGTETPSPSPEPAPSPAPSGGSTETPLPSNTSWTIRADGIGTLRLGMTSAEASAALGSPLVRDPAVSGPECTYSKAALPTGDTLSVMLANDRIVRVEPSFKQDIRSYNGLGKGSTEADVRAKHPNLRTDPHAYTAGGKYLITYPLADTTLRIIYETDDTGTVTDLRGGRVPFVGYPEGCS